ncbi:MAG: CoA-binding protein [Myxococcales bacterium]|nr:CoA-binding protein [Myxococcales bacterium]
MNTSQRAAERAAIDDFLAHHRIALVGASRDERDFSRLLMRDLADKGYEVLPVNPGADAIAGQRCYAHVADIDPPPEGALLMTPAEQSAELVRECADAGIERVWLHRGAGRGAVSDEALAVARERGIKVVPGQCPYMFIDGDRGPHRVHRWFKKLVRRYPERAACPAGAVVPPHEQKALWPMAAWTWLLLLAIAFTAGALRTVLLEPYVEPYVAHFIGTIFAATLLLYAGALSMRSVAGRESTLRLLAVGAAWVAATVAFEFFFFGFVMGHPISGLLANYDIGSGRLWPMLLMVVFLTPLVARAWARDD